VQEARDERQVPKSTGEKRAMANRTLEVAAVFPRCFHDPRRYMVVPVKANAFLLISLVLLYLYFYSGFFSTPLMVFNWGHQLL